MKIILHQRRSGIALIIVMIAVISLSILAGIYAYSMKVEAKLAMNTNNDADLEWMGRSAVEKAKSMLALDAKMNNTDSLDDIWAGGTGGAAGTNFSPADWNMQGLPLGKGTVSVQIPMIDLESKANINQADDTLLEQALIEMGVDAGQSPTIVNSIRDWIDPDDKTRVDGAESDYYQAFEPPFEPKNGPIDDLSELLLIKGINETPELYWGPAAEGQLPSRIQKNSSTRLGFHAEVPLYPVGLRDLFTPISSGRINLNTASAAVLQLIPGVDERAAQEIIRLRAGPEGAGIVPLNNPGELVNAGIPPNTVQQISRYTDVHSRTFEVHVSAEINGYTRHFVAIVVRNNARDLQTISFHSTDDLSK